MNIKKYLYPLLIILAGVVFTLYLQQQVPEGVYFSGDAGLKALLAQQWSAGHLRFDLIPPPETWVRNLWDQGLYPYEEPYVYNVNEQYYITFPFTFPLVSAPFHALFGYRGLYLVPLIATWVTWLVFLGVCRWLKLNNFLVSIALIALIFASPLTLYSAMYWEHTLAVALCFSGLAVLFLPNLFSLSKGRAILSGCLVGLSVWFRPEFLCMAALLPVLIYCISIVNSSKLQTKNNSQAIFLVSLFTTISLFFVLNKLIYGYFLGIHGIQAVKESSLTQKIKDTWNNFEGLSWSFLEFFPAAYFPALYIVAAFLHRKIRFTFKLAIAYIICFLFVLGVSLLVPVGTAGLIAGGKQWGPRFLLILIPVISLLATMELVSIMSAVSRIYKYASISIISLLLFFGIYKNTYLGTKYLQQTHREVSPAIQFLRQDAGEVIAVSHQFVAQALEPSVSLEKLWFKVEDSQALTKLGAALVDEGKQKFIYICYPYRRCNLPEEMEGFEFVQKDRSFRIEASKLGEFGKYPVYQATLR